MNWTTEGVYFNNSFLKGRSIQEVGLLRTVYVINHSKQFSKTYMIGDKRALGFYLISNCKITCCIDYALYVTAFC